MLGARKFAIKKEQELRVAPKNANAKVFVTLLRTDGGTAEIFGTELAPSRRYAVLRVRSEPT
jgi:hypothetical protein